MTRSPILHRRRARLFPPAPQWPVADRVFGTRTGHELRDVSTTAAGASSTRHRFAIVLTGPGAKYGWSVDGMPVSLGCDNG